MKRFIPFLSAALCILMCAGLLSCRRTATDAVTVRHYAFADSTRYAQMSMSVELPDSAGPVSGAVRRALLKVLDGALSHVTSYEEGRLFPPYAGGCGDTEALLAYYRDSAFAQVARLAREDVLDRQENILADADLSEERKREMIAAAPLWGYDYSLEEVSDTLDYIVFLSQDYIYMGGAHGGVTGAGYFTFDRRDGSLVEDMVDPSQTDALQPLLARGLVSYYRGFGEEMTEEQLPDRLQLLEDRIPLPAWTPYPTADGLTFVYQQYEIACYADGMPAFTVPYEDIGPFLTPHARDLLIR